MSPDPSIPLADGSLSLDSLTDPVVIDPDPPLLDAAVDAYCDAYPTVADPDLDALRGEGLDEPTPEVSGADATLTVLAAPDAIDGVTGGFHAESRLAALTETGLLDLSTLDDPQPNAVLAARETACVLVESPPSETNESGRDDARRRIGDDPALYDRYADTVESADSWRPRTPSRWQVYDGFDERCTGAVAADVIRLFDADPDLSGDDVVDPRIRAYVVGARHGVLDHDLRRACEDAGLGSPSTFTGVKRRLIAADLVRTERVPQPVGRPRERIVAEPNLADPPLSAVAEAVQDALERE